MSEEIQKKAFIPQRSIYSRNSKLPKMWLCNVKTTHGVTLINADTPDKPTIELECFCTQCLEIDEDKYKYGRPVQCGSVSEEELVKQGYVGLWYTRKGYEQHKKEMKECQK